jgi:hypothetical protein
VNGEELSVTKLNGKVAVNGVELDQPDLEATNGIIHVVGKVLLPPKQGWLVIKGIIKTHTVMNRMIKMIALVGLLLGAGCDSLRPERGQHGKQCRTGYGP